MKHFIYGYSLSLILSILLMSCIGGTDDDDIDEVRPGKLPLSAGNKWIYDISYEGTAGFTDSAVVLGYENYFTDSLVSRFLYRYRNFALSPEMLSQDTLFVDLVEYDTDRLLRYGTERTDRSDFLYGRSEIFDPPQVLNDGEKTASEVLTDIPGLYIISEGKEIISVNSLTVISGGYERTVSDTLVDCFVTRNIFSSGGSLPDLRYDLYIYYSGMGILKMTGSVNGRDFYAGLVRSSVN